MKNYKRLLPIIGIVIAIALLWYFDVFQYFQIERIQELKVFIDQFGLISPLIFILTYIMATVFFLPGLPLTLLAGVLFGPLFGTVWVSIASTAGATFAFLVGRYSGRQFVVDKFSKSDLFIKLDQGVKKQGWKMVAITRLVPLFPFNAQNYAYGLTSIPLKTYVLVSFLCMLPGTIAYIFLSGAIIGGEGDVGKTITYIGIGIGLLVALSFISKMLINKNSIKKED
jgi:uncharacterized membrane protein YdjX (TVP38/TMEM64 family)